MRSTRRSFMAVILFIAAAGVCLAQEPNTAPPPQAPPAVKPAAELPPIPLAKPEALPVAPALTADPAALTVEPLPSVVAVPPAALKTVTKTTKHVAKKTSRKPDAQPVVPMTDSSKTAAPAASVAVVEPPANTSPAEVAAKTAPAASIAPPAPALKAAAVETSTEPTQSKTQMGVGGWILFGIGVVGLFGAITVIRRRRANAQRQAPIFTSPALKPAVSRRT